MRRREFITLLGGAACVAARGERAAAGDAGDRVPRRQIAWHDRGPSARISPRPERHRLCRGRERSDRIPLGRGSIRSAAGAGGRIGSPAGRRDRSDLATAAAVAAKAATTAIPIVFIVGDDPVRLGLVASLARPGGNLTGINIFTSELVAKRLELLREMVPAATRVAVLVSPHNASSESTVRDMAAAARAMGLQVQVLNADTSGEIDAAFATLARERSDALFVDPNPFFTSRRVHLVNLASRLAVPAIYFDRAFAEIGGLMSYGASLTDAYRQGGVYTARILKGAKPADLPVLQSSKFELVINSPDRQDAWPHRAAVAARPRRRGDRIRRVLRLSAAGHIATNPKAQNLRSVLMQSGHLWTSGLGRTCSECPDSDPGVGSEMM